MNPSSKLRRVVSVLLALVLVCSLLPAALRVSAVTINPSAGRIVVSQTDYPLVDGVTMTKFFLNNTAGNGQLACYMVSTAPGAAVTYKASYAGYYTSQDPEARAEIAAHMEWALQRTTDQARAYEQATGGNVIMATNGDYFNMQTGQPLGCLVMEGNVVQTGAAGSAPEPYFAVLTDGSFVIRPAGSSLEDVAEAISGPVYLVRDGVNQISDPAGDLYPVNSIGMKADGTVVTLLVDGRQSPYSTGMTLHELADLLIAQGVVDALYLDGGGSATLAAKPEGTDSLTIQNRPSDGIERTVSSALLLVSTASADGVFDHASLRPDNERYTPTRDASVPTRVAFTALGVDSAGGPADLPAEAVWVLEDPACGTVDPDSGLFTAAVDYVGEVRVSLRLEGETVGSTSILLCEPDELYFDSLTKSMDFGETADLGLNARVQMSPIQYKAGDFAWSVLDETGAEDPAIGSVTDNLFTSGVSASTMQGTVRAAYTRLDGTVLTASIDLEIGKLPIVVHDFEPIDGQVQEAAHFHWGKDVYVSNGMNPNGGYILRNSDSVTVPVSTNGSNRPEDWTYNTFTSPIVFSGNYDTAVPAAEIFRMDGYRYYLWPNATIDAYLAGKLGTTSAADGGQVRFGDYSLELNFDYASYNGTKNSNYYLRYCGERYLIEGQPTQVGVWVYADAETYNLNGYLLYSDIAIWNGSGYGTKNFPLVHDLVREDGTVYQSANTDWVGWMYCYANLDGSAYVDIDGKVSYWADIRSSYSPEHPYILRCGEGFLWLSYQPAMGGGRYNGTLYFDNFRYVYGTNLDDLDNPILEGVTVNGVPLSETGVSTVDAAGVEIVASYRDFDGKNASGIAASKTLFLIDGLEARPDAGETEAIYRLNLANGRHCVTVTVYDAFGNYSTGTYYFDVNDGGETACVTLVGDDTVTMGADYVLTLDARGTVNAAAVQVIQLNADFGEPAVAFAEGWTGEAVYAGTGFKKSKLTLTAQWTGEGAAPAEAEIARISFNVPSTLDPEIDFFTYQVLRAEADLPDGSVAVTAQEKVTLPLSAYLTVTPGLCVAGHDTVLTVTDPEGRPVAGAAVQINGAEAGVTDALGCFTTDVSRTADSFTVRASLGDKVSFTTTVTVLAVAGDPSGLPVNLTETASKDGSRIQTITWMANLDAAANAAVVEYGTEPDLTDAVSVTGESTVHAFATTKNAAYINTVRITGLTPGTTYYYRAGDGIPEHWSGIRSFRTVPVSGDLRFFILADTQMEGDPAADAEAIAMLREIGSRVAGYDFGIQTGDFVDSGANYAMWSEIQTIFSEAFQGLDVIHILGNHEYSNDPAGEACALIYRFDEADRRCWSLRYGDLYIAGINNLRYGTISQSELEQALAWIAGDMEGLQASWRILVIHQPAYYTNVSGGNERVHETLPPAVDAMGFDLVFSGHDHSYARTEMLRGGEVVEAGGTVYFIGGDLGEKSRVTGYAAVNNPAFHFACVDQEHYEALYLDAAVEGETLTVTARNYDGTPIDTVTLHSRCYGGHSFELYEDGCAICSVCGKHLNTQEIGYTGWLTLKGTENNENPGRMYFLGGVFRTGWFQLEDDMLHFGADGLLHETVTVDGRTCTESGRLVTTCLTCGAKYYSPVMYRLGHTWDENHVCTVCGTVGVDIATLPWTNVGQVYVYDREGRTIRPTPKITDGDKVLGLKNSTMAQDGYLYWEHYDRIGTAIVGVEGRGDYYGVLEIPYRIVPDKVRNVTLTAASPDSLTLTWDPVLRAETYAVFFWDSAAKTMYEVGQTPETEITLTGLTPAARYTLCVKARVTVDGEDYDSYSYTWVYANTAASHTHNWGEPAWTWNEDLTAAAARFVCACGDAQVLDAEITEEITLEPTDKAEGEKTITAKVVFNGSEYTDVRTVVLDKLAHACPCAAFTDMPEYGTVEHDAIDWAFTADPQITNGTGDTAFGPEQTVTRGQAVTFLWRAAGCPEPTNTSHTFTDVKESGYYYKAMLWAVEKGITNGTSATTFSPKKTCTNEQILTFIYRYMGEPAVQTAENPWSDVKDGSFSFQAIMWAVENGIAAPKSETVFGRKDDCTRAAIVTYLYRIVTGQGLIEP